jgi:hypothetical protein
MSKTCQGKHVKNMLIFSLNLSFKMRINYHRLIALRKQLVVECVPAWPSEPATAVNVLTSIRMLPSSTFNSVNFKFGSTFSYLRSRWNFGIFNIQHR